MEKKEINIKGYKVVVSEDTDFSLEQQFLTSAIESYAFLCNRSLKVVFFNVDDDGEEAGVTFFFRKEKGSYHTNV